MYNLLYFIFDKCGTADEFIEYLDAVLDNYIDYNNLNDEDQIKIESYIFNYMNQNSNKKKGESLKIIYENNPIITFEEFTEIILQDNEKRIFMDNTAVEYLLYLMKKSVIHEVINDMDSLNIHIFLSFCN